MFPNLNIIANRRKGGLVPIRPFSVGEIRKSSSGENYPLIIYIPPIKDLIIWIDVKHNFPNKLENNVLASEVTVNYSLEHLNFFENAISVENLKAAWYQLKSNPGMLTPGATSSTLNGITERWFIKTNERLLNGTYIYPIRKRIQIPKPNKNETRPLTISDPKVKIIERALLNVLEPIMEGTWNWVKIESKEY